MLLKADNIKVSSIKEKEENNEKYVFNRSFFRSSYLDKKEIKEKYISSNILSNNILVYSKNTNILGSNIKAKALKANNLSIESNIFNNRYVENKKSFLKSNNIEIDYENISKSNILVDDLNVDNIKVKGSNIEVNSLVSNNSKIESSVLNTKLKEINSSFKFIDGTTLFSHKVNKKDNSYEKIEKSNVSIKEKVDIDKLDILSSNVILNNAKIKHLSVKSQELNNKENENDYTGGLKVGLGINLNIQNQNLKSDSKIYENTNLILTGNAVIENKLDVTNTNLSYDNLVVNAKDVNFKAIKDKEDIKENTSSFNLGLNLNISSPILNDVIILGRGAKSLINGRLDRAISNISNGYFGAVNHLSSNVKINKSFIDENNNILTKYVIPTKEDLDSVGTKLEKDISGYLSASIGLSLNISNKNILIHNEEVKGNTLVGNKLVFNNNKEVNYTSTVLKNSNIEYNNTRSIIKDVLVEEKRKNITDFSFNLGIGSSLDVKKLEFSPINVNLGLKASNDKKEEKIVRLNKLINTNEKYKGVEELIVKGIEIKDYTLKGDVAKLSIEEAKDEIIRNKVGAGFDISLPIIGFNVEGELVDKKEENVSKNDIDLTNLKIKNLIIKEEKTNNHNIDAGFRAGTSGISARVDKYSIDLSSNVISAVMKPKEFKYKQYLALKDIESTFKGLNSKINNISKTTNDELTDISEEEKRSFIELSNYHLNAEYVVRKINEKEAKSKKQREELTKEIGFKNLKVLEKITEENINKLPEGLKKRYYEVKERGEELRVVVDQYSNVYTFGDLSELEFKKALARELGIHNNGRITQEGKLLGATSGNIYSEYVINGSEEIEQLSKDEMLSIPSDAEVISDNLIKDFSKKVWSIMKENVPPGLITMDVYVSTKTLGKHVVKGAELTSLQALVLTVSVIDGFDEINKYISCGTIYGDCDTLLKKFLGNDVYRVSKGVATLVGVTQIGKSIYTGTIKDGKIIKFGKKVTDINEIKAVFSSLKESGKKVLNKGKNLIIGTLKSDEALDVGNTVSTKIDDILSISKQNDIPIVKNSVNGKIVSNNGYKVSYDTEKYGHKIDDIIKHGDATGAKTEKIVDGILRDNPNLEVYNGKYGGNKGIDHLVYNKTTGEYWIIDSKQIAKTKTLESGGMRLLENAAQNKRQLSENWIKAVANKLPKNEKDLLLRIVNEKNYRTAVIGVNKNTGEIILVPISVENK